MELGRALRTTGAVRAFRDERVADETVARILDTARFAPSGGNRQGWHVVVVKDPETRRRLRDLYLPGWYDYLAMSASGMVAWSPLNDREAEAAAVTAAPALAAEGRKRPGDFAEHLDTVPVLLAVFADLGALAATDRDLPRYTFTGGASVYPFVWSILLAARDEGLAGVLTTMAVRQESGVRALLGAPEHVALAAVVALGVPLHQPRRLARARVSSFCTFDRFDGPPLADPTEG